MSLSSVMNTALTGMNAASTIVDVVAHNVANLQTDGFKASEVRLATLPSQTSFSGGNPIQTGLGVQVVGIDVDSTPGPLDAEGNELSNVDLGEELIDLTLAGVLFRANVAVFQTADGLLEELFSSRRR